MWPASTATPLGALAPVMKLWSTPVPSRLARPIVSVPTVGPVDVAGVDRDAARAAGAGDEALVDAGAVEVGAADRVRACEFAQ